MDQQISVTPRGQFSNQIIKYEDLPHGKSFSTKLLLSGLILLTIIAISVGAYVIIPTKVANNLMHSYVAERSYEWYDEINELELLQDEYFRGVRTIDDKTATLIRNLARAGGIYRVSLLNRNLETVWTTSPFVDEIFIENTASDILKDSDRVFEANVTVMRLPESEIEDISTEYHQNDNHAYSSQYSYAAESIIPDNQLGDTRGYVKINYDVDRNFTWYESNLKRSILFGSLVIILAYIIIMIINFAVGMRMQNAMNKTIEIEQAFDSARKKQTKEMAQIREFSEWMQTSKSLPEYYRLLQKFMMEILPNYSGTLYIFDHDRENLSLATSWHLENEHVAASIQGDSCWALRKGRNYYYGQNSINFRCEHLEQDSQEHYVCLPILANGEAIGTLTLIPINDNIEKEQADYDIKIANMCVEQISMSLANASLRDRLEIQNLTDPLTSLFNRRGFTQAIEAMKIQHNNGFDIVFIDLDHFKSFNDQFGHDAGDAVLVQVSELLLAECDGKAYRLGGEELALILPPKKQKEQFEFVDAIRQKLSNKTFNCNGKDLPQVTASFGVVHFGADIQNIEVALKLADTALYQAKEAGRNIVIWYQTAEKASEKLKLTAPKK